MLMLLMIAGSIFILALAVYSIILWRRVWQTEQQRKQQRAVQKKQLHDDLIILTDSFITEQMPWAEGCIRIKVILDHYDFELGMHTDYQVLHQVFNATENIPTHDAWRALSSAEKQPYQALLAELELQHKQASVQAIEHLRKHLKG
ncbi:MAG TPA: DUF2489 domain-containing protein [Gammaproteobacteria bacterium]|nr:DUF2489 domain-containing protein [Gammaproteobacteria bacterium]